MLLHCPAYAQCRASLRAEIARLLAAQDSPIILADEEGVIALLRDDFMGGALEAASAVDAFLCGIVTFSLKALGVGAWISGYATSLLSARLPVRIPPMTRGIFCDSAQIRPVVATPETPMTGAT